MSKLVRLEVKFRENVVSERRRTNAVVLKQQVPGGKSSIKKNVHIFSLRFQTGPNPDGYLNLFFFGDVLMFSWSDPV